MSTFRNFNFKGVRWLLPSSFAGVHSEFTRVDSVPCMQLSLVPHSSVVSSPSWSPLHPKLSFLSFMWGPLRAFTKVSPARVAQPERSDTEEKPCHCFTLASCKPLNPAPFGWHCQVWLPAWDGPCAFNHISSRFGSVAFEEQRMRGPRGVVGGLAGGSCPKDSLPVLQLRVGRIRKAYCPGSYGLSSSTNLDCNIKLPSLFFLAIFYISFCPNCTFSWRTCINIFSSNDAIDPTCL